MFYVTLFLYIVALLAGTAATTICSVSVQRRSDSFSRVILLTMAAILVYLVMSIFLGLIVSRGYDFLYVWIAVIFCDLAYFAVIIAWIDLLLYLIGKQESRWVKLAKLLIVGYMVAVECLVLFTEIMNNIKKDGFRYGEAMNTIVKTLDLFFMLLLLVISIRFLLHAIRMRQERPMKRQTILLSMILLGEDMYSAYQDHFLGPYREHGSTATLWIDPLLVLFLVVSIVFLKQFRNGNLAGLVQGSGADVESVLETFSDEIGLTARESEILHLVYEGYNNEEIADEMGISVNTAKHHLSHLFAKSGTKNKHELLAVLSQELSRNI